MNVAMEKTIFVMKMPSVLTQMVALHVNVKKDIQEMELPVMVSDFMTLLKRSHYFLLDINECSNVDDNNCHENAICTNTNGSFTCQCQNGYTGNGTTCNGK